MEEQGHKNSNTTLPTVETMTDPDVGVDDPMHSKEKHTLLEELLHPTNGNASSSSDEEVEEGGESKKRKKKGLKDKIRQKLSGEKEEGNKLPENATNNSIEVENAEVTNPDEKKGFLDKIKEKLPGHHHKRAEGGASVPCAGEDSPRGDQTKEKKGIMDKIIDKLPGHHKNEGETKEKEN